jgi:hypothetical protein
LPSYRTAVAITAFGLYAGVNGRSVKVAVATCSGPLSPPSSAR